MTLPFSKVSIVGLGYIGLPTAATIATRGIEVVGVDINETAVQKINRGESHFAEPDLDILLKSAVTTGKLRAVTSPEQAEVFVIAVPTPFNADKSPDMTHVEKAACSVAKVLKAGDLVILESTSPVGATVGYVATATASGSGSQRDDDDCQVFTIDQSGTRGASDSGGAESAEITARCWR